VIREDLIDRVSGDAENTGFVRRSYGRTPANGTTVYEVTAYAFLWDVPGTLMNQVDATAPFTYTIGS